MDTIIGFIMLLFFCAYGGYSLVAKDFNYDLKFLLQMVVSAGGAFYILGWQNLSKIKNLFKRKEGDPAMPEDKPANPEKDEGKQSCCVKCPCYSMLDSKEMQDFSTLVYLKSRAKELNSQEMLDLVVKINTLLFSSALQEKQ
jgi:hypothetical protein